MAAPSLLVLALAAPAGAQTLTGTTYRPVTDPWSGIAVTITPVPDDTAPYDDAETAETAGTERAAAEPPAALAQEDEDHNMPSLWTILTFGLGGDTPDVPEEKKAPNQLLPERRSVATTKTNTLPTRVELNQGPASLAITGNASGSAPSSGALNSSAGGASGEIKGRLGVEQNNLAVYSTGSLGASASTGTPTLSDNLAVGSSYSVPLAPLGLGDQKLGASVEMDNAHNVTTGLELRAPLGTYERFISVERSTPADSNASGVVKAGVLGKF